MILSKLERSVPNVVSPGNRLLGYMGDFWTVIAASAQSGYPVSNLLTSDLNQKWVSWGQRASQNWIEATSDVKGSARHIYLAALLGIDRTNPSQPDLGGSFSVNGYRMIIDTLYPIATRRRPPVETVSLTNLVGTAAMLNGPIDPPTLIPVGYTTTKMSATNPSTATVLIAEFYNYNATERPLHPTTQTLRVHYAHSANILTLPTLTVKMRYAGVTLNPALVAQKIEQTSEGYIFTYTFNPSSFAGLTGRVGVRIDGTAVGASTPVPIGIEWVSELNWGGGANADSSWQTNGNFAYPQLVEIPEKPALGEDENGNIGTMGPYEIFDGETVRVYIEPKDWVQTIGNNVIPLGGHESSAFYAGRLVIADGISMGLKPIGGYNRRKESDLGALRTRGGHFRGSRNPLHWDEHDFSARIQSESVVYSELEPFFENAGKRNPVVIVPDETIPGNTIYGIITRWELNDAGTWVDPDTNTTEQYADLQFSVVDARARRTLR